MVLRPPVKWHGGKRYLATRIIAEFPKHRVYVEPFGGGASVLLNKEPVDVEIYNDLDGRIVRLFRVLRDFGDKFLAKARLTPYALAEFDDAGRPARKSDDVDKALRDFVRWRQSFGGKGKNWSRTTSRARGGMAGDVNAWWTAIDQLPQIVDRLRRVQIECSPAIEVIERYDQKGALIYCDPPYVHATRSKGGTDVYGVEMSDADHEDLAKVLATCRSKVVLSGYPSTLYERLYRNWRRVEFDIANHSAGGKTKRRERECLWINY